MVEQEQEGRLGQVLRRAGIAYAVLGALVACDARSSRVPTSPRAGTAPLANEWRGFGGSLEIDGGGRVDVDLAPLHADPQRQAIDAQAWRAALQLGPGEPFALDVACSTELGTALDLSNLTVVDRDGAALATISSHASGPVAVLAAPPRAPLAAGERIRVLLWGRAPKDEARLRLPGDRAIELASSVREGVRASGALARIPASPASAADAGGAAR